MTKKVEELAEFYRQNGWEEAASVLEADAQRFREAGIPDELPGQRARRKTEERTFTPLPSKLKVRLIQILSDVQLPDVARQKHLLQTDGLAERINQDVGQYMQSDTHLNTVRVTEQGKYEYFGDEFTHMGKYRIDKRVMGSFNATLTTLVKNGIETAGDVRTASLGNLMRAGLGEYKARFIRKALAPMNSSQGRASR